MVALPRIRSLSKALIFNLIVSILVSVTAMPMISPGIRIQRMEREVRPVHCRRRLAVSQSTYSRCPIELVQVPIDCPSAWTAARALNM